MAIEVSSIAIEVKSQGIAQAAQDMKALAEAARNVDKETRTLLLTTAKAAAKKLIDEDARNKLIQQKQDIWNYNQSVKEYIAAHTEALKINRALKAEEDRRNLIQQKRDYESYTQSVKEQTSALQEEARAAAALEKAHGMALEMNKRFDRKALIEEQRRVAQSAKEQEKAHNEAALAMERLGGSGSILNNTLKSMIVAASAYLSINFAKGIIEAADGWGQMQAKLKISVGSMEGAVAIQQSLYESAQKLRIPLADSVQLFNRMSVPIMNMGRSTSDTTKVVEGMGMALKLAGATGQEASSVMLQFSQSMQSGRLNGAEFNAVAEGAPLILRAIEAELRRMGMGTELASKGLKKLASDGVLTSEVITNAIINARSNWEKDFNQLPLTFDGAMQRLKNSWEKAIGDVAKNTKFNEAFAKLVGDLESSLPAIATTIANTLSFVANNFDKLMEAGKMLGIVIAASFVGSAATNIVTFISLLGTATSAAGSLSLALKGIGLTPLGAAFTAVGLAVYTAVGYYQDFTRQTEEAKKKQEEFTKIVPNAIAAVDGQVNALKKQVDLLRERNGLEKIYTDAQGKVKSAPADLGEDQKVMMRIRQEKDALAIMEAKRDSYKKQFGSTYYYQGNSEIALQKTMIANLEKEAAPLKARMEEAKKLSEEVKVQSTAAKGKEIAAKIDDSTKSKDDKEADKLQKLLDEAKKYNQENKDTQVPLKQILALEQKIREIRSDDKPRQAARVHLNLAEKEAAALEEVLAKQRELLGIEGDGKRTSAEKKLTELEAQKTKLEQMTTAQAAKDNIDKKAALTDVEAAIALAKRRAGIESQIVSIEEQKKAEAEFTNGLKEKLKTLEKEEETYGRKAQAIGLEKDAIAKLRAEQEAETLTRMQREQAKQTDIDLQNKIADAAKRVYEEEKKIADQRRAEKVADLMQKVNIDPKSVDDAKKAKLRMQAAEDIKLVNSVDITQDPVITSDQAKADARLAIARKLKEDLDAIDAARVQVQLTSAESIAGSLASIAANTAGKQSGIYKAMFAVQKGFAIAKAALDLQMAISNTSWSLGFPANLAAMAQVAAAGAAIVSNITSIGYEKGGYTGNYGTSEVAGVVHGQEFVVNASGTARHRALLEAINRGQDPAMIDNIINMPPPSVVSNSNGGMNVTVENHGTSIETQQITPNEIRIIARREARDAVRKDAGNVVSAAIAQPNSNVSKALGRNTQTQRRRN